MNKLLHERLRDFADSSGCKGCNHLASMAGSGCDEFDTCTDCINAAATAIADEIEKYYIPRPRFENGEPVQFGDDIEIYNRTGLLDSGTIQSFHPNNGSVWMLSLVGVNHERLVRFDPGTCVIKRPEHKVLDADGVEIKVGDTVWIIESGDKGKVEEINKDRAYVKCDDGWLADVHVSNLTHREPDSLEKLRNDMREFVDTEYKIPGGTKTNEWLDRLTAIMERDA